MAGGILVTGATGNVGGAVVDALVAAGQSVRAASRTPPATPRPGVEAVRLELTTPGTWGAFSGVSTLLLVRPPQVSNVRRDLLPAMAAARSAGVRHVVFLSVQGADRIRVVPHAAVEEWLRGSGLGWTFVRPSFFCQNLSTTHAATIRRQDRMVMPAGHGRTSFVDALDVAAVAVEALLDPGRHTGRAWTPTGPAALTYDEVAAVLTEVLHRRITYSRPGLAAYARHARRELGMPVGMVAVTAAIYTAARLGRAAGLTDDVRAVTGRSARSFREFAERERAAWLN